MAAKKKTTAADLIGSADGRTDKLALNRLKNEISFLKKENKDLIEALEDSNARTELLASLDTNDKPVTIKRREKKSRQREATAFIMCSDWHVGEEVRRETTNGYNEFNPAIARHRVEKLAEGASWLVNFHRNEDNKPNGQRFYIRDVVINLIGDMITGWLHQDQRVTNTLLPTPEVLEAYDLIKYMIDYILQEVQPESLTITGNFGNHARMTMKTLHSAQAETSLEWLIYQFLRRQYADDKRVKFAICGGKLLRLDCYDTTVRISHGDDIGYGGGIGGVTIPINKAIKAWNQTWHADLDLMGHWHQYVSLPYLNINSSLIGYSPYGIKIKAPYEPPTQSFFLVEPFKGKRADNRIWVQSSNELEQAKRALERNKLRVR